MPHSHLVYAEFGSVRYKLDLADMSDHLNFSEQAAAERLDLHELHILLERLDAPCEVERSLKEMDTDDTVTVAAVCEATGVPASEVIDILAEVRERVTEARMAHAIRELEAPLFNVERPGVAKPDGVRHLPPVSRAKLFSGLLDDVVRARQPKVRIPVDTQSEKLGRFVANAILVFLVLMFGVIGVFVVQAMTR